MFINKTSFASTFKSGLYAYALLVVFSACNNNEDAAMTDIKDSTSNVQGKENAAMQTDTMGRVSPTDTATASFLQKAADGGLTEVAAGEMAQKKGNDEGVKRFATMMVQDHTGANAEVKTLSAQRNVTLPTEPSQEHRSKMDKVGEKDGKSFDKAYMDMMVDDHRNTISLFENASKNSGDEQVKNFITTTLPKLKMHLDSALAIRKKLP